MKALLLLSVLAIAGCDTVEDGLPEPDATAGALVDAEGDGPNEGSAIDDVDSGLDVDPATDADSGVDVDTAIVPDAAPDTTDDIGSDAVDDAPDTETESCEVGCSDCCGDGRVCMDFGTNVCGEVGGRCALANELCPDLTNTRIGLTTCDGHCSDRGLCHSRRAAVRTNGRQYLCLLPLPTQTCDLAAADSTCPEGETCIATTCIEGVCSGGCFSLSELISRSDSYRVCATSASSPFLDTGECWENAAEAWASGYNGLLYVPEEERYQ
jgi:hypothetical protein